MFNVISFFNIDIFFEITIKMRFIDFSFNLCLKLLLISIFSLQDQDDLPFKKGEILYIISKDGKSLQNVSVTKSKLNLNL